MGNGLQYTRLTRLAVRMCQRESLVGLKATLQVTRILHGIMLVKPTKDATFTISERLRIHTIQESRKRIHTICSTSKENIVYLHDAAKITNETKRLQAKKNLERRISAMIPKKYSKENCIRFVKRLKRERMMLFTFLQTGTDYHNNTAEGNTTKRHN